jgi:hypothetical protein
MKIDSTMGWNANKAFLEEVINQVSRANISLSESDFGNGIEALKTCYDMACSRVTNETDSEIDKEFAQATSGFLNFVKQENSINKITSNISLSQKCHEINRKIIRLMVKNKLIKLDPDDIDPVEEVNNDY